MNRTTWLLVCVVVLELLAGGVAMVYRARMPLPPWPVEDGLTQLDRDELQQLYQRAVRGGRRAWVELARSYAAYGFLPEAIVCYRAMADSHGPADPQVLFELGFFCGQLGHAEEAVKYLHAAIQRGYSERERAWYFIAQNEMRQEHVQEAKAALRRAEPLPAATYELARIFNKTGQPQQALDRIEPLIRAFRYSYPPYFVKLRAHHLLGQDQQEWQAALDWLRMASPLHGPFDDLHEEVSQRRAAVAFERAKKNCYQLLNDGRLEELQRELDRLTQMKWSADLADLRAELATKLGHRAEAEAILREAVRRHGATLHLLWRLGDILYETGRYEEAWQVWEEAAQVGLGNRELDQFLAYVMLKAEGRSEMARGRHYDGARWLTEGRIRLARGEFADACESLRKATTFFPNDAQVWYLFAEAAWRNRQIAEAQQAYQKCLALNPHHGRALLSQAFVR